LPVPQFDITHCVVLPSSYQTICWPVTGDHHRSPIEGPEGDTGETVMKGSRVTSCGVEAGGGSGVTRGSLGDVTAPPEGCVCTQAPTPVDGLVYQTYSRPVTVLNHRSPSTGPAGGVGELVTVGGAGIVPPGFQRARE
jgi:hypothetical protein